MTIQYENIYQTFSALPYLDKLSLIQDIQHRRKSFVTPKKVKKAADKKQSTKRSNKNQLHSLVDSMSEEEKAKLLEEIGD